ncbi:MAG: MFS transporter [Deltaproteobacteria bacterium]|nr:MFS transporter [Deltaproteobacteria bacterium]
MAAERALTFGQQLSYAVGNMGVGLLPTLIGSWAMYYFSPPPGEGLPSYIPLMVVGWVLFIGRLGEAIINPFIGYWSDRTRSKLGRRIPYIMYGTLPMTIAAVLMWFPLVHRESMINAAWVAVMMTGMCVLFAVVVAPYLSLLPELTPYNDERIRLSSIMAVFEIVGLLLAGGAAGVVIDAWKTGVPGLPAAFNGFNLSAMAVGALTLAAFYTTAFRVKEREFTPSKEVSFGFRASFGESLKNSAFPPYLFMVVAFRIGIDTVVVVIPYMVTTVMGGTELHAGFIQMGIMLAAIALFYPVTILSDRLGKKKCFLVGSLGFLVVMPLVVTIGKWPFLSPMAQGIVVFLLAAFPAATFSVLPRPLLADIIDHDEKLTTYRREAMYNGVEGLFTRSASGLAWVLSATLFYLFGNSAENPLGVLLCGPVAAVFILAGTLVFRKYPFER